MLLPGLIAHQANLSMALGAFIAGLVLAETEYGKAIETVVEPFKGLLLGIFFFTVGMNIDFREFLREPIWLLAAVVCLIVVKSVILTGLGRLFKLRGFPPIETGLLLGPGGEFAFVGIGMATALGIDGASGVELHARFDIDNNGIDAVVSTAARKLSSALAPPADDRSRADRPAAGWREHAIVVGYGRIGKVVCSLLKEHGIHVYRSRP